MNLIMSISVGVLPYLLFAVGSYLFGTGLSAWIRGSRQYGEPGGRLLGMVQGFRVGIIGPAVVGVGLWLLTDRLWILVLSLAVAAEEVAETSFIIWAIRSDPRLQSPEVRDQETPERPRNGSASSDPLRRAGHRPAS